MSIGKKVRQLWHDVFVGLNNRHLFRFADTCRNVVTSIDLDEKERDLTSQVRFAFHLSMCQACMNYYRFSKTLARELKLNSAANPLPDNFQLESLQKRLNAEFANGKKSTHENN